MTRIIAPPTTGAPPPPPPRPRPTGGGRPGGLPSHRHIARFLFAVLALLLVGGAALVVQALRWRPMTVVASLAGAAGASWWRKRRERRGIARDTARGVDCDGDEASTVLGGILGGVAGELLGYQVLGVPESVPPGIAWWLVGAGGIGGAVGAGIGLFVMYVEVMVPALGALLPIARRRRARDA